MSSSVFASMAFASILAIVKYRSSRTCLNKQERRGLYLGFDFSTQSFTTVVIEGDTNEIVYQNQVQYDEAFPFFQTKHGTIQESQDSRSFTAPSLMFVHAVDRALKDIPFAIRKQIVAISGSAQQHGSVYWKHSKGLRMDGQPYDPSKSLVENLKDSFAITNGPIWMDSSTDFYCDAVNSSLSPQKVADITGSKAYERFTANQIAKILNKSNESSLQIGRISLLSSFLASILIGKFAPIDQSDGSGMNLMDLRKGKWSTEMVTKYAELGKVSPDRFRQLIGPDPCPSSFNLGNIDEYFVQKYGFNHDCQVIAFSGDNPCTIAGLKLEQNDSAISLGTSTTVLALSSHVVPSGREGHVMKSPLGADDDNRHYMAMICFKNGDLPRANLCRRFAKGDWTIFDSLIDTTTSTHFYLTFAFPESEITPQLKKPCLRAFDLKSLRKVDFEKLTPNLAITSVVLAQCLALRVHADSLGISHPTRIIATGGGSKSKNILQMMSDVFNCPVFTAVQGSNTAALGAAFRAKHGHLLGSNPGISFKEAVGEATIELRARPRPEMQAMISELLVKYRTLEEKIVEEFS